jgi:hypothetical protein
MGGTEKRFSATEIERMAYQEFTRMSKVIEQLENGNLLYLSALFEQYKSILRTLCEHHEHADSVKANMLQEVVKNLKLTEARFEFDSSTIAKAPNEATIRQDMSHSLRYICQILQQGGI